MRHVPVPIRYRAALATVGLGLVLASCGDGKPTVSPTEATAEVAPPESSEDTAGSPLVEIERSRFAPLELQVEAGTRVTFRNLDPYAHTVTAKSDSALRYDSGPFGEDEVFEQTYDEPGTYAYFCEIHPTMRATVIVG